MKPRYIILLLSLTLLALTLACATVMNIFTTQAPTPAPQPVRLTVEIPTETVPTAAPEVSCPDSLREIMIAALAPAEDISIGDTVFSEGTFIAVYTVTGDLISDPFYYDSIPADLQDEQQDTASHQQVWDYFTALIPAERRGLLAEYSIMTDGQDNTLAAVSQTYRDPALWALEVDIADISNKGNLTFTLIHEFGHLLTLGPDQVPPSLEIFNNPDDDAIYAQELAACPVYFPGEGCSRPESYINAFHAQFWTDIDAEWQEMDLIEDDDAYYQALDDFYYKYQDQFVTDYAVTSPEEDIAESWSFFVLGPEPTGDTISEKKILFFYNYPELALLRDEILSNLCTVYP